MALRDLFAKKPPADTPSEPVDPDAAPRVRIGEAADRQRVAVEGVVDALAARPHGATSWLEATLSDGSGQVVLTWMGREHVPGIDVGRRLVAEGRLTASDGQLRLYNPRYTLL